MAVTSTIVGLTRRLERSTALLAAAAGAGTAIGANVFKRTIDEEMSAAGITNGRLRGVGRRGAAVSIRVTTHGPSVSNVYAKGPLWLVERDTKAHGGHPGTVGRHPFAKGIERGRVEAVAAVRSSITAAFKKAFA